MKIHVFPDFKTSQYIGPMSPTPGPMTIKLMLLQVPMGCISSISLMMIGPRVGEIEHPKVEITGCWKPIFWHGLRAKYHQNRDSKAHFSVCQGLYLDNPWSDGLQTYVTSRTHGGNKQHKYGVNPSTGSCLLVPYKQNLGKYKKTTTFWSDFESFSGFLVTCAPPSIASGEFRKF